MFEHYEAWIHPGANLGVILKPSWLDVVAIGRCL